MPVKSRVFLALVVTVVTSCAIDDVTLIEPGDAGGVGGTHTGGNAGQGGAATEGGTAGTSTGGVGGSAGNGGSAGGGAGGASGAGGLAGTGGTGTGGTGPVGPPVLQGTFVGASVAGTASGIQIRGSITWHASIHGNGANGLTLEGWLQ